MTAGEKEFLTADVKKESTVYSRSFPVLFYFEASYLPAAAKCLTERVVCRVPSADRRPFLHISGSSFCNNTSAIFCEASTL